MLNLMFIVFGCGLLALLFASARSRWINRQTVTNPVLIEVGGYISEGASAFMRREYTALTPFILGVALLLLIFNQGALRFQSLAFLLGALASALAGLIGMKVATQANSRTAQAAHDHGLNNALQVAFAGGSVMGMSVVGLALIGLFLVFFSSIRAYGLTEDTLSQIALPLGT